MGEGRRLKWTGGMRLPALKCGDFMFPAQLEIIFGTNLEFWEVSEPNDQNETCHISNEDKIEHMNETCQID